MLDKVFIANKFPGSIFFTNFYTFYNTFTAALYTNIEKRQSKK